MDEVKLEGRVQEHTLNAPPDHLGRGTKPKLIFLMFLHLKVFPQIPGKVMQQLILKVIIKQV